MTTNRRNFIKKTAAGAAGLTLGGAVTNISASSYKRIIGANERLNVAIAGLGRRLGAFVPPVALAGSNVKLVYLCDVMQSQMQKAAQRFASVIDYKPKLEEDIRKILDDPEIDLIINATPDHWHALGWVAVLLAALVMHFVDWPIIDPLLSIAFTLFILFNVLRNLRSTARLFFQAVPDTALLAQIEQRLLTQPQVREVHHLHLWSLDGEQHVLSAHLVVELEELSQYQQLKSQVELLLSDFSLLNTTIEIELATEACRDRRH